MHPIHALELARLRRKFGPDGMPRDLHEKLQRDLAEASETAPASRPLPGPYVCRRRPTLWQLLRRAAKA